MSVRLLEWVMVSGVEISAVVLAAVCELEQYVHGLCVNSA